MSGDYISREAVRNALYEADAITMKGVAILNQFPAADVVKAGEAEWRYQTMTVPGGKGQTYAKWSCSACKGKQKKRSRYCPDCGKRMKDGGQDDGI